MAGALLVSATPATAQAPTAAETRAAVRIDPAMIHGLQWRYVGPSRGGRVTAVAGTAAQPSTF
jgi:hypothetical protein